MPNFRKGPEADLLPHAVACALVRKGGSFRVNIAKPPAARTAATRYEPAAKLPVFAVTKPKIVGAVRLPIWPKLLMKAMLPADSSSVRKRVGIVQKSAVADRYPTASMARQATAMIQLDAATAMARTAAEARKRRRRSASAFLVADPNSGIK